MIETQQGIVDWATATFGDAPTLGRVLVRALEEACELLRCLSEKDSDPRAGEEAADVLIVLMRPAEAMDFDLLAVANEIAGERQLYNEGRKNMKFAVAAANWLLRAVNWSYGGLGPDGVMEPNSKGRSHVAMAAANILQMLTNMGVDAGELIDAKMQVNRVRQWRRDGTGHGYHIKGAA